MQSIDYGVIAVLLTNLNTDLSIFIYTSGSLMLSHINDDC
jgi:hypothetical protein